MSAPDTPTPDRDDAAAPLIRVVAGEPTPEELAALVSVLAAAGGAAPKPRRAPSRWASPAGRLPQPINHGLGAWRGSVLPH